LPKIKEDKMKVREFKELVAGFDDDTEIVFFANTGAGDEEIKLAESNDYTQEGGESIIQLFFDRETL
jgi:hypothetical protein